MSVRLRKLEICCMLLAALAAIQVLLVRCACALEEFQIIATHSIAGGFASVHRGSAAPVLVSSNAWAGALRATGSFAGDVRRASELAPEVLCGMFMVTTASWSAR